MPCDVQHKPISPDNHILIDYAFAALHLAAPAIFGFKGAARDLSIAFGGLSAIAAATTDTRYAVKPLMPPQVHKMVETAVLPTMLALPMLTGAAKDPVARTFFLGGFIGMLATYLLTDFNAGVSRTAARPGSPTGPTFAGRGDHVGRTAKSEMELEDRLQGEACPVEPRPAYAGEPVL